MEKTQNSSSRKYLLLMVLFICAKFIDFFSAFVLSKFLTKEVIWMIISYIILFSVLGYLWKKSRFFRYIWATFIFWFAGFIVLFSKLKIPGWDSILYFGIWILPFIFLMMYIQVAWRVYKNLQQSFPKLWILRNLLTLFFAFLYYINIWPISWYAILLIDFMILWNGLNTIDQWRWNSGKSFNIFLFIASLFIFTLVSWFISSIDITIDDWDELAFVFAILSAFYGFWLMLIFSQIEAAIRWVKYAKIT